jgi:DNA-binding transcriptional ArsR family regulator
VLFGVVGEVVCLADGKRGVYGDVGFGAKGVADPRDPYIPNTGDAADCQDRSGGRVHEVRVDCMHVMSVPSTQQATGTAAPVGHSEEPTAAQVSAAVVSFAMLADPTRIRILWALRSGQADVTTLATAAGCRPTVASQHLSKLRLAGLVEGSRHGRRVLYRLRGGHVRNLLREAMVHADHQVTGEPVHD